jgi:hypothetical protein
VIELAAVFGVAVTIIALFGGIVWLAERKAKADLLEEQRNAEMDRLRAAIEADARGRERIARGELLQDDGHRRD